VDGARLDEGRQRHRQRRLSRPGAMRRRGRRERGRR
jgi:hypothetical protein